MSGGGWRGRLSVHYRRQGERCIAFDRHEGPLRVLQPLYPEGPGICHHVLVHPPGGIVGGDELQLELRLDEGAHAVLTTPGATRFYRSDGAAALQQVQLQVAAGARLEWLPLETIAHPGCLAASRVRAELAPGAEMMGWELLVLGLPASGQHFDSGSFEQRIELPGIWLDGGCTVAGDLLLRQSPLGWAGHTVLATLWWAAGQRLPPPRRAALLDAAREVLAANALAATAGVTSPQPSLLVLRALAPQVEPAMQLLAAVRAAWRRQAWQLTPAAPRIWQT